MSIGYNGSNDLNNELTEEMYDEIAKLKRAQAHPGLTKEEFFTLVGAHSLDPSITVAWRALEFHGYKIVRK